MKSVQRQFGFISTNFFDLFKDDMQKIGAGGAAP